MEPSCGTIFEGGAQQSCQLSTDLPRSITWRLAVHVCGDFNCQPCSCTGNAAPKHRADSQSKRKTMREITFCPARSSSGSSDSHTLLNCGKGMNISAPVGACRSY